LYVVWMRVPNTKTNELLVAGYSNGKWSPAIAIDSKPVERSNLSIRFTRQIQTLLRDGTYGDTNALILHAAWWQKSPATGEGAYYAVMPLSQRWQPQADVHELAEFADVSVRQPSSAVDDAFMRQVALVAGPTSNAVDTIFSDSRSENFYRATLRPIAET